MTPDRSAARGFTYDPTPLLSRVCARYDLARSPKSRGTFATLRARNLSVFYFCSTFGPVLVVPLDSPRLSKNGHFPYEKRDRLLTTSDQIKSAISEF